jgi:hypothetical protein
VRCAAVVRGRTLYKVSNFVYHLYYLYRL